MTLQLRPYQQEAMQSLYDYWQSGKGRNPVVAACVGAGKSILIAKLVEDACERWKGTRILMLTHLAELIEQNAAALKKWYPAAEIGIFSAGLKKKEWKQDIIFAGIQSIEKHLHKFDPFDIVMIDEVHLVPKRADTRYRRALDLLKMMNPNVVVIGYSGSPYRLDGGWLHKGENAFFDGIAYDISIKQLVELGYLVPAVGKKAVNTADLTGVKKTAGEFNGKQMEAAFNNDAVSTAVNELVKYGQDRRSWIVFCAGVAHAERVTSLLVDQGIDAELITGKTPKDERADIAARHKRGELRCLVNVNTLTAGFDSTATDLVAIMRPTMSTALFVQMCGRGLRLHEGKEDCLILDYGGNFERHGPIDDVQVKQPGKKGDGDPPAKSCPECFSIVHCSSRECPDCGYLFPERKVNHSRQAYDGAVMTSEDVGAWVPVDGVSYYRHKKKGKPDSVRVEYRSGLMQVYKDWWMLEHGGFPTVKTKKELLKLCEQPPETTDELLELAPTLLTPQAIYVKKEGKYDRIIKKSYTRSSEVLCNLL